jgi:Ferritin-like domain
MRGGSAAGGRGGWTRAQLLRGAVAAGAAAGGTALLASRGGDGAAVAAPSRRQDAEILRLFLTLESVQRAFYREALDAGALDGPVEAFARAAGRQEEAHVARLRREVRPGRGMRVRSRFGAAARDPERFKATAIDLEELAIAAYIGQGGNLTPATLTVVVPLVSVEARQAAWIRDLAGRSPAPRAADPARSPDAVLADLRQAGFLA